MNYIKNDITQYIHLGGLEQQENIVEVLTELIDTKFESISFEDALQIINYFSIEIDKLEKQLLMDKSFVPFKFSDVKRQQKEINKLNAAFNRKLLHISKYVTKVKAKLLVV